MLALNLVLVLTSALAGDLSPQELIAHLHSADRVVREEAARTLEELGSEVLPALRAARESSSGPETRKRFADLIDRIDARCLDRPTMVVLDVNDRPLNEAVQALATHSGFSLALDAPAFASGQVTVRASGPLPFWEALDRLGRAGHVRHDPGPRDQVVSNDRRAMTIDLVAGDPPAPAAYSGPLRIHLFATHRHRDVNFEAKPVSPVSSTMPKLTVEVQAFAEPGRFINPNGQPRLEAVDLQGRAISPRAGGDSEQTNPSEHSWLMPGRISLLQWHVPMGIPSVCAGSPLKIRGVLPVVISSRKPGPLIIPLADAAGKTFRQGPGVVRIDRVSTREQKPIEVDFFLSEVEGPSDRTRPSAGPEKDYIGDYIPNRIEFEDAEGRLVSWLFLFDRPTTTPDGKLVVRIFVSGDVPPARLLVYRLNRLATEIAFEIGDVPAP